jgi:hypothetical protein
MPSANEIIQYKIKICEPKNKEMRDLNLLHLRNKEKLSYVALAEMFRMPLSEVKKICKKVLTSE